ncbi:glycosyltransferase family 9 protein [Acidobacteriota bacterium]
MSDNGRTVEKGRRILLLLKGGVGDVLMFTPALEALARTLTDTPIDAVVGNPGSLRVLEGNRYLDNVFLFDRKSPAKVREVFRIFRNLRRYKYGISITQAVDFGYGAGVMAYFSGAGKRIGPDIPWGNRFYNCRVPMIANEHFILRNYALVKRAGARQPLNRNMWFHVSSEERALIEKRLSENSVDTDRFLIAVHTGCGPWRPVKRWPGHKWAGLISQLTHVKDASVVCIEEGMKQHALDRIYGDADSNVFVIKNEHLTLGELGALIERCNLFISSDGGPLHLAASVRTPTVALFGPTDCRLFAPLGSQHVVVKKDLSCAPCIDCFSLDTHGCEEATCMESILEEEVVEIILKKMKS